MRSLKSLRPSPALVVSIIALVVATAGTTYALTVPKKSVGTPQLKRKAVTTKKLAPGAVASSKLGPTVRRFADVTVPDGPAPPAGGGGITGQVACGRGERLLTGGAWIIPNDVPDVPITASHPGSPHTGTIFFGPPGIERSWDQNWTATAYNENGGSGDVTMRIFAVCLQ
jgi:hypothetical protein